MLGEIILHSTKLRSVAGWQPQLTRLVRRRTPVYSYRVFTVEAGGHTPFHNHPYEHMNYIIEGSGALVNEAGEETPLKAGDFALVNPSEKHQYRNKGDQPFKMICGVPKEFE